MFSQNIGLQIKPVGSFCNIQCDYCYAEPFKHPNRTVMGDEIIKKTLTDFAKTANSPVISWHGGEPTVAGVDFFRNAIEIMSTLKWKAPVVNQIQTNATLITPEFAKLFKDNGFQVGTSLDGNEYMHNLYRKDKAGNPTFTKVLEGIKTLREAGLDPWVIVTVTKENALFPKEAFESLLEFGFTNIRFTPVFDVAGNTFGISPEQWGDYLNTIFDLWFDLENPDIHIRELEQIMAWYVDKETSLCNGMNRCANWVSIDENGDMYPCEYFKADFPYGNILEMSFTDIPKTAAFQNYYQLFTTPPTKCLDCEYRKYCGNGCPGTRVVDGNMDPTGVDYYCEAKKLVYNHVASVFDQFY